jgi:hypothetical protein
MTSANIDERRRTPRRLLGRLATITGIGISQRCCLVTDISAEGVRLHINGFVVPDDFVLFFPKDGPAQSGDYKVVWRVGQDVGAKFVSPSSNPDSDPLVSG